MADLNEVMEHLGIDERELPLIRSGKKAQLHNRYMYFNNRYYIVNVSMSPSRWVILDDAPLTRQLLVRFTWHLNADGIVQSGYKYDIKLLHDAILNVKAIHRDFHTRYDYRAFNLVSFHKSTANNDKRVRRYEIGGQGYYRALLYDINGNKLSKVFSVRRHGEDGARERALTQLSEWEDHIGSS